MGLKVESRAVHLRTAGIQRAEHGTAAGVGRRQRFQRGHRGAERLPGEGQTLHRRQPDAQAGKAAGAGIDAVEVDVLAAHAAELETVVDEGHQGLAVGHARVKIALVEQAVVLQQGHAHGLARRIHG